VHELSIASAIAAIAGEHAQGRRVTAIEVKIGRLRQVVPEALAFAFELTTAETELEGANLVVEHVPARVDCRACGAETEVAEFPLACASCGSADVDVVAGDELLVETLELEDEALRSVTATAGGR
jgi:hydrogenase nickel incorporation protein HypA/HybF